MGNYTIFRCSKILGEADKQDILRKLTLGAPDLFPELEATYSRKSRWGGIAIYQNIYSRSWNQNCQGIF